MTSACFLAAPEELSIAFCSLLKSESDAFTIANRPDIASCPAIAAAYWDFWLSVNLENFSLNSAIVCLIGFMDPSAFVVLIPKALNAAAASVGGFTSRVRIDLNSVPACDPLIPAFAINPTAVAVSSILYFIDPARGATYLNVSPIIATLVLELLDALASTSAKCPESFAFNPKAVIESVTMSDTVPRSSPDAAAKFMTPDNPETI